MDSLPVLKIEVACRERIVYHLIPALLLWGNPFPENLLLHLPLLPLVPESLKADLQIQSLSHEGHYSAVGIQFSNAEGAFLYTSEGRRLVNLSESNNILGQRNPLVIGAIEGHISSRHLHYPLTVSYPDSAADIIRSLTSLSGMSRVSGTFSSSGTEACDVALTALSETGPVITLEGSYHGLTGQFINKRKVDRAIHGNEYEIPFPSDRTSMRDVEKCVENGASSIIVEPLQVESGFRAVYSDFFSDLRNEFPDLMICIDESYTGMGKTGRLFSYQIYSMVPDVLIIGKAIGGGIPLGITLFSKGIAEGNSFISSLRNGVFGSTSGNLLSLTLASLVISQVTGDSFLSEVRRKGELITSKLSDTSGNRIRGFGLARGVGFASPVEARDFSLKLLDEGVFASAMGDAIRISPPLTIDDSTLSDALEKIKKLMESS